MGYNSVIMLCNDALDAIDKDPYGWWMKTWRALSALPGHALPKEEQKYATDSGEYGHGSYANGFQAVWNRHSSSVGLIAVGHNRAEVLLDTYVAVHKSFHTKEGKVALLKELADKLGYRVVKKNTKKMKVNGL